MQYGAIITREGEQVLAEFPDAPGCQTFADPGEDIATRAAEALEGWLEVGLEDGEVPPRPRFVPRLGVEKGAEVLWVSVSPQLAVALQLRQARDAAGLTQAQLAARAGVSQQQIAKLERPQANPTIETLVKVATALGVQLDIVLDAHPAR